MAGPMSKGTRVDLKMLFLLCVIITAFHSPLLLAANLPEIEQSIGKLQSEINNAGNTSYLPSLYLSLAEFYVEKSKILVAQKLAVSQNKNPDLSVELQPRYKAIDTLTLLIDKFPQFNQRNRALFIKFHELLSLNLISEMQETAQLMLRSYPNDTFTAQALVMLGDFFLDQEKNLEEAQTQFEKSLTIRSSSVRSYAQYKIGWIHFNRDHFFEATSLFVQALKTEKQIDKSKISTESESYFHKHNVQKEALKALARAIVEVPRKQIQQKFLGQQNLVSYFHTLASQPEPLREGLSQLGRRLLIKNRFVEATEAFYEQLRLSTQVVDQIDAIRSLYRAQTQSQTKWPIEGLNLEIKKIVYSMIDNDSIPLSQRNQWFTSLEVVARDMSTRQHQRARKVRSPQQWIKTTFSYENYLAAFSQFPQAELMRRNLAEVYFTQEEYVKAGLLYEQLLVKAESRDRPHLLLSAVQSFTEALKRTKSLSSTQLLQARGGLRKLGKTYIQSFPDNQVSREILFNISQSYYDQRDFYSAIERFIQFIKKYPNTNRTGSAIELTMDALYQLDLKEKYIKIGRWLRAHSQIKDSSLLQQLDLMIQDMELRLVQQKAGNVSEAEYTAEMLKLARKYQGSDLGDKALYEAFTRYKKLGDPKAFKTGEVLALQHKNSEYAEPVIEQMAELATAGGLFQRVALYWELFSDRYPRHASRSERLKTAAQIRELTGEYLLAARDYGFLQEWSLAAKNLTVTRNWSQLSQLASKIPGAEGRYWKAVALAELSGLKQVKESFAQLSRDPGLSVEQKIHSEFLVLLSDYNDFTRLQVLSPNDQSTLQAKIQIFQNLNVSLPRLIQRGHPIWSVAANYVLAQINDQLAATLIDSGIPANLGRQQQEQYQEELLKQAGQYRQQAKVLFANCIHAAEQAQVFHTYVLACARKGVGVSPAVTVTQQVPKARNVNNKVISQLQNQMLKSEAQGQSHLAIRLAQAHLAIKDPTSARLVLEKMKDSSSRRLKLLGMTQLWVGDYSAAVSSFKKILQQDPRDHLSRLALYSIYRMFGFSEAKKYRTKTAISARDWPYELPVSIRALKSKSR